MNLFIVFLLVYYTLAVIKSISIDRLKISSRIIGGRFVDIENYPYQLYLRDRTGLWWCGASIISENWAITAAHCVANRQKENFVLLSNTTFGNMSNSGAIIHEIDHFKIHELYKYNRRFGLPDYDVAVIKIKDSFFKRNSKAAAIRLPAPETSLHEGEMGIISGWGLSDARRQLGDQLQAVEVPIINHSQCKALYERIYWEVTDRMVCAGYEDGGRSACNGDSGGPMMINNTLVGVVSGAYRCALPNFPEVFADITFFRDWITNNTGV